MVYSQPCPWCGSICHLKLMVGALPPGALHAQLEAPAAVRCEKCKIDGPTGRGTEAAWEKWNTRIRLFGDGQVDVLEPEKPRSILQALVKELSEKHPPGTPCYFWTGKKQGPGTEGLIKSWVIIDYHVMAFVQGIGGAIKLTHVEFAAQLTLFER